MAVQRKRMGHRLQRLVRACVRLPRDGRGLQQTCWVAVVNLNFVRGCRRFHEKLYAYLIELVYVQWFTLVTLNETRDVETRDTRRAEVR